MDCSYLRTRVRTALALLAATLFASQAFAHPMGNFSINHYTAIRIGQGQIELHYIIDMAEIPTFQEMQESGITAQGDDPRLEGYLASRGRELAQGAQLTLDGNPLPLRTVSQRAIFPPGAGNLPTLRLMFVYRASVSRGGNCSSCELVYRDSNFAGRAGWKEVIATAEPDVTILNSTVPTQDRSAGLGNYPSDLLNSPPQDLEATIKFSRQTAAAQTTPAHRPNARLHYPPPELPKPAPTAAPQGHEPQTLAPTPHLQANRPSTPRNAFTELIGTQTISFGFIMLAALIAAGLGALHALEPGHGKTIVAAYLVGSKGTARHAFLLGLIVTASHTAGVYLLGVVTIYAQRYIFPERIYPFMAVLSGAFIAGMGFYLFLQRFVPGALPHSHRHGPPGHYHSHAGFWHSHAHGSDHDHRDHLPRSADRGSEVSVRELLVLGITGGIVPCPAALVVLLSAVALRRITFGLFLIVCFSIGLAAVLISMGLVAIYAARIMSRLPVEGPLVQRWLPMASAVMITVLGCSIAVRGLITAGVLQLKV